MEDCIFCKIIAGEVPGYVISENENVIVLQSLENHPLVIPKKHVKDIYELDEKTGGEIMAEVVKISKAVKKGQNCDGITIKIANEPAGGQHVFHIHVHIYPRWKDTPILEFVTIDDKEREITAAKIKQALR